MTEKNKHKAVLSAIVFIVLGCVFVFSQTVAGDSGSDVAGPEIQITADDFRCLTEMTAVRHFYVDNLAGDLEGTLAVANSATGGVYPPGSVVQLVPGEVMVKHRNGWNAATRDWEFFELDVTAEGSSIRTRGFVDVVNKFGGNCFGCHVKAKPQWDLICEKDHGCDPIPVTSEQILAMQQADPRCAAAAGDEGGTSGE